MAQTKTRSSRRSSTSSRSKNAGGSRRGGGSSGQTRKRQASTQSSRSRQESQGKSTARTVAEKAKKPALAAGAAIVGLAGGMAIQNGKKRNGMLSHLPRPNLKTAKAMKLPKFDRGRVNADDALDAIGKAAGQVAQRSHRFGEVAAGVQKASEAISNGKSGRE